MNSPHFHKRVIDQAIILAAGMSTRMRPLSDHKPKALVRVKNYPLIDYIITKLIKLNIDNIVINLHYHADLLEAHLKRWKDVNISLSSERKYLLDSGGGVQRMISNLSKQRKPFFLFNCDVLWDDRYTGENIFILNDTWDESKMDILLMLVKGENSLGYDGKGDFFLSDDMRLKRRGKSTSAPYIYTGMAIIHPSTFDQSPEGRFNLNTIFDKALRYRRLYGVELKGHWLHVGTPEARKQAEDYLSSNTELEKSLYHYAPTPLLSPSTKKIDDRCI